MNKNMLAGGGGRVVYVDLLKGLGIFGVVWLHSSAHPSWLTSDMVNALFFYLSGMFFKADAPYSLFLKKRFGGIMVPFLFFYLMSYPFRIVVHLWDFRSLSGFNWSCLWDVFDCAARADYLYVNVPLWFLMCLFVIQAIYWFACKLPAWCVLLGAIFLLVLRPLVDGIPSPFMLNNALVWMAYFAIGNVCKGQVFELLATRGRCLAVAALSALALVSLGLVGGWVSPLVYAHALQPAFLMSFILLGLSSASLMSQLWRGGSLLRYWGENTLLILGIHIWFEIPLMRVANLLLGMGTATMWTGFAVSLATMGCCWAFIRYIAPRIPYAVGKKNLLYHTFTR